MRKGKIGFQWGEHNGKWELVNYQTGTSGNHYVIAFFDKGKEGYDMRTVGNRFFEDEDALFVAKQAMLFLEVLFEKELGEGE